MIRTFQALKQVPPGFSEPEHIQTLRISIPTSEVRDPVAVIQVQQQIMEIGRGDSRRVLRRAHERHPDGRRRVA
jgi:hypothetical protein